MILKKSNYLNIINDLSNIHRNKLFHFGLIVKIFLIFYFTPTINNDLFLPFIRSTLENPSFDPWSNYLLSNGNVEAFPYGIIMLITYSPLCLFGEFVDKYIYDINAFELGFKLTSLIFDYLLLIILFYLVNKKSTSLLLLSYWLSPIVIFTNFIHGQLDIVPISLLIFSAFLIKLNKYSISGLTIGIAISSKFSILIALPFFLIYIYKKRGFEKELYRFISFLSLTTSILNLPFFSSDGFSRMVLQTKELDRIYTLFINYGPEIKVYILPVVFVFSLYLFWRLDRITQDLFLVSVGIGFLSILVFIPPATGWILWVIPFLIYYLITFKKDFILITVIYNFVFIFNNFHNQDLYYIDDIFSPLSSYKNSIYISNIGFTLQQTLGLLLALRMYIYGLKRNNFYSTSAKSILIEIKGDSSQYIKFLLLSLKNLINKKEIYLNSTCSILGLNFTEMDSKANNNFIYYANHISDNISKIDEELFNNNKTYQFLLNNSKINLNLLRKKIDLNVVINKAVESKKNNISFDQITNNGLFFELKSLKKETKNENKQYSLITFFPLGFLHNKLFNLFISIASLKVDIELIDKERVVKMIIEGHPTKEDIIQISRSLISEIDDLSLNEIGWEEGYLGIIQVIIIANLSVFLKNQRILK